MQCQKENIFPFQHRFCDGYVGVIYMSLISNSCMTYEEKHLMFYRIIFCPTHIKHVSHIITVSFIWLLVTEYTYLLLLLVINEISIHINVLSITHHKHQFKCKKDNNH